MLYISSQFFSLKVNHEIYDPDNDPHSRSSPRFYNLSDRLFATNSHMRFVRFAMFSNGDANTT